MTKGSGKLTELAEVSMLLGHSALRVTMDIYAHLQKADGCEGRAGDGCDPRGEGMSGMRP